MGAGAYNRGSRAIAREADTQMAVASKRADRQAAADEATELRARVAKLERELARARRAIAAERYAREKRVAELKAEISDYRFGTAVLCRIAFPGDKEDECLS